MLNTFLLGATAMALATAGLFFLKFWKKSGDSLFLMFSLAFEVFAVERCALAFLRSDFMVQVYLLRLMGFLLILSAIIHKNRGQT